MDSAYFGLTNKKPYYTDYNNLMSTEIINSSHNYYNQLIDKIIDKCGKKKKVLRNIKKVIFSNPATIVLWNDGTKTVVKCGENETFDEEKGLAMAIAKRALGNDGVYYEVFKKWLPNDEDRDHK